MGKDFFERYYDLLAHQRDLEELTCFRHGFHLAVRLLLG